MSNLIEQVQAETVDSSASLSSLLLKVKLIAAKLEMGETAEWVNAELQGYGDSKDEYPAYRRTVGRVMAYSSYHGWQPPEGNSQILDALSERYIADSVSAIEDILDQDGGGTLSLPISSSVKNGFLEDNPGWTDMHTEIQRSALVSVLDHVRTMVLNWALELESKGISGEGVTFSESEKTVAQTSSISIENFHGNLHSGDIQGTQNRINQGSTDHSTNILSEGTLFSDIREVAETLSEKYQKDLIELVEQLEENQKKAGFFDAYHKFVSMASDHASLLPFVPALAALIPGS